MLVMGYKVSEGMVLLQNGEVIFRLVVAKTDPFRVHLSFEMSSEKGVSWRREKFERFPDANPADDENYYVPHFYLERARFHRFQGAAETALTKTITTRVGEGMVLEQNGKMVFLLIVNRINRSHVCLSIDKPEEGSPGISWSREKFKRLPPPNAPDEFFDSDYYIPEFF